MIDAMKPRHDGNGNFEPSTYALERLTDSEGKEYWEYLKLGQIADGKYSVAVLNAMTGTTHSGSFHDTYAAGYYTFKVQSTKRNGGDDLYITRYGETRENRRQALALYYDHLCHNTRSISDFERYYLGSYSDLSQFAFNSLANAFTESDLPSLGIELKDLNFKAIVDRWFDPVSGTLTVISVERSYGKIYHIYQIPTNPGIDAMNSTKSELNNVFDLLGA